LEEEKKLEVRLAIHTPARAPPFGSAQRRAKSQCGTATAAPSKTAKQRSCVRTGAATGSRRQSSSSAPPPRRRHGEVGFFFSPAILRTPRIAPPPVLRSLSRESFLAHRRNISMMMSRERSVSTGGRGGGGRRETRSNERHPRVTLSVQSGDIECTGA
jgi:hypothetical protein